MISKIRLLYPVLFAAVPILSLTSANAPGSYTIADVTIGVAVSMGAALALYGLLVLLLGRRWPMERIALLVLIVVTSFWVYRTVYKIVARRVGEGTTTHVALTAAGLIIVVVALVWLFRRPNLLDRLTTFLGLVGSMLVAWSIIGIVSHQMRNRRAINGSALVRELARPIPPPDSIPGPKRDIYLILLDEYANTAVLREFYDFDNRPFEDSLRQLGFTIPLLTRSNYTYTSFSLPSLLNFAFLTDLSGLNTHLPHYLLSHNRAAAFLKSQGYRYVFFPSQWWISTRHQASADQEIGAWDNVGFVRGLTTTNLWRELRLKSLLAFTPVGDYRNDVDYVLHTFEKLKTLPPSDQPTFVFAHILSPHGPFVMNRNCGFIGGRPAGVPADEYYKDVYLQQIECVNHQMLELIPHLIARSRERRGIDPVILVQSDHGPRLTQDFEAADDVADLRPAQVRERLGVFAAYYLPDGGARSFQDTVTMVNVLPKVFNYYLGTSLPMLPNQFYVFFQGQDTLYRIDPGLLDGKVAAAGR